MQLKARTLKEELLHQRKKNISVENLLEEVYTILHLNELERNSIKSNLTSKSSTNTNDFDFELLETDKIFHINQIEKVCTDYRLRFLNSSLFKNEIPEEAISEIRTLEKTHKTTLEGFKIMAPSKAFNLKNYDDPLLFAPIGNDYYYLIHKWGNDLAWYRKIAVLPLKNIINFTFFCFLVSLVLTFLTPETKLSKSISYAPLIIFLFMFKSIVGTVSYYFFMMGKNFNNMIWNREFKEN
ncbi:hypothetical protein [Flavobacterium sp.]|uniref:hypothetical protein n=1 Tax=Flavobacterium sp. TaxID=239 RepID=UPI00261B4B33|nr:hypothetical protein [Flavobacterium sp.]